MINSLLFLSQLVIPTLPSNVTEDNFIKESIATVSCVDSVEEDSIVEALSEDGSSTVVTKKLIVVSKAGSKAAACAAQVVKEIDGLTIDSVLPTIGLFIVSYEVPASK